SASFHCAGMPGRNFLEACKSHPMCRQHSCEDARAARRGLGLSLEDMAKPPGSPANEYREHLGSRQIHARRSTRSWSCQMYKQEGGSRHKICPTVRRLLRTHALGDEPSLALACGQWPRRPARELTRIAQNCGRE